MGDIWVAVFRGLRIRAIFGWKFDGGDCGYGGYFVAVLRRIEDMEDISVAVLRGLNEYVGDVWVAISLADCGYGGYLGGSFTGSCGYG